MKNHDMKELEARYVERLQRGAQVIEKLRTQVADLANRPREPIAIVGMSCRFPGRASSLDGYWELLSQGEDGVVEVPEQRWRLADFYDADVDAEGKMYTRHIGALTEPDAFDNDFFGISPREALSLDPQQRLLLETSWEALEHARIAPNSLLGSATGVYVGMMGTEYTTGTVTTYSGTGSAPSTAAGRISYTLGLRGPSMILDTACSSSLVALHLACQSLRNREIDLALVGGVNVIISPLGSIALCKLRALSTLGRCSTFAAAADGYVRGEGCGMLVLKRLSAAQANGDRVLAVVRGSSVNQDGRSAGLTVPNGLAQQDVVRAALANAGVDAAEIDYVEAHGTGTPLGDPIELQALNAVLGEGRRESGPLWVGSAKTNFGHLEAAAGVAGLIKVVLAMQHRQIPAHLHFDAPNPLVDWSALNLRIPTKQTAWPLRDGPCRAGVSSFGLSGTNAHVILESAPAEPDTGCPSEFMPGLLLLSGSDDKALRAQASAYEAWLAERPGACLTSVCRSAATTRSPLPVRAALLFRERQELEGELRALAEGRATERCVVGGEEREPGLIAMVYSETPPLSYQAATVLYEREPVFRAAIDRLGRAVHDRWPRPFKSLWPHAEDSEETVYSQALQFATAHALSELWKSWACTPDVVVGWGTGVFAAATAAGVLVPEEAILLLSAQAGIPGSRPFPELLGEAELAAPEIDLLSGQSGEIVGDEIAEPAYWMGLGAQGPSPEGVTAKLLEIGVTTCLSPSGVLLPVSASGHTSASSCPPTEHAVEDPHDRLYGALAELHAGGRRIAWSQVVSSWGGSVLDLPTYRFQRTKFWKAPAPASSSAAPSVADSARELPPVFMLSATDEAGLRTRARRYAAWLESRRDLDLHSLCTAVAHDGELLAHRLAIPASSWEQLTAALHAFAQGRNAPQVVYGRVGADAPKVAFLFSGQGSQYAGMGAQLYARVARFRHAIDRCAEILDPLLGVPLTDLLFVDDESAAERLAETRYLQPALFALEYALSELWRSLGVEPSAVLGHSLGEYVAAHVAGVFELADALRLVAIRARLMHELPVKGGMAATDAPPDYVEALVQGHDQLALAAYNGPHAHVLSGTTAALAWAEAHLLEAGFRVRALKVSNAFHSALMDPMLTAFSNHVREVPRSAPRLALISNLTGRLADDQIGTPEYWSRHVREPVLYCQGVRTLEAGGTNILLELGPSATLLAMADASLREGASTTLVASLRHGREECAEISSAIARLFVAGVDSLRPAPPLTAPLIELPSFPKTHLGLGRDGLLGVQLPSMAHAPELIAWQVTSESATWFDREHLQARFLSLPSYLRAAEAALDVHYPSWRGVHGLRGSVEMDVEPDHEAAGEFQVCASAHAGHASASIFYRASSAAPWRRAALFETVEANGPSPFAGMPSHLLAGPVEEAVDHAERVRPRDPRIRVLSLVESRGALTAEVELGSALGDSLGAALEALALIAATRHEVDTLLSVRSVERLVQHASLPERCRLSLWTTQGDWQTSDVHCNAMLFDLGQNRLMELEGVQLTRAEAKQRDAQTSAFEFDPRFRGRLSELAAEEAHARVTDLVCEQIAGATGRDRTLLNPSTGIARLGLDSLMMVQCRKAFEEALAIEVSIRALFEQSTIGGLATVLLQQRLSRELREQLASGSEERGQNDLVAASRRIEEIVL